MKILFSIGFMALSIAAFGQVSKRATANSTSEEQLVSKLERIAVQITDGEQADFKTLQAAVSGTMTEVIEYRMKQPDEAINENAKKSQQQSTPRSGRDRDQYLRQKAKQQQKSVSEKGEQLTKIKNQRLQRIQQEILAIDQSDKDGIKKINQMTLKFIKTLRHEEQR